MGPIAAFLVGVVLPTLISVVTMGTGASTPGEFLVVRVCTGLAVFDVFGVTLWELYKHDGESYWYYVLGAAILAALAVGAPKIFLWIDQKEIIATTPIPKDVGKIDIVIDTNKSFADRRIEIGDGGAVFNLHGPNADQALTIFRIMRLKLENINGKLAVSTQITDPHKQIIAELIRNEWKVAPNPLTWDRNYNANTLEVKNGAGRIVLQVRLLPDRIQLQGEWWEDERHGFRLVATDDPKVGGGFIIKFPDNRPEDSPFVKPLFEYPSNLHFGELLK